MAALREGSVYDVSLEARSLLVDGLDVPAYHARPDGLPRAGVVLHPDIMGLRPLFEDMARRLATNGFAVVTLEPVCACATTLGSGCGGGDGVDLPMCSL